MYNYLITEHEITFRKYARKYHYLSDSREDMYQDLVCYVIESLSKYKGGMTNMNSLITLLIQRRINRLIDKKYGNNGFRKELEYIPETELDKTSEYPEEAFIFVHDLSDLFINISKLDDTSIKIVSMLVEGYTKDEIRQYLNETHSLFNTLYDIACEKLGKIFKGVGYEMQTV